jgi:hypothetical protein
MHWVCVVVSLRENSRPDFRPPDAHLQDTMLVILHLDLIWSTRSLQARATEKDYFVSFHSDVLRNLRP